MCLDSRSFISQRLSDWFTNLAEARTRSRAENTQNNTSQAQPIDESAILTGSSEINQVADLNAESDSTEEVETSSNEMLTEASQVTADESAKTRYILTSLSL